MRCSFMPNPRPLPAAAAFFAGVMLLALFAGCGIKSPPVPPKAPPLPAIKNLTADLDDNGVVRLQWHQPQEAGQVAAYLVYKAQSDASAEACAGCPILFTKIGRVDRSGDASAFEFTDTVPAGASVRYKVVPIRASGAPGPDSNIVVLQVPSSQTLEPPPSGQGE